MMGRGEAGRKVVPPKESFSLREGGERPCLLFKEMLVLFPPRSLALQSQLLSLPNPGDPLCVLNRGGTESKGGTVSRLPLS